MGLGSGCGGRQVGHELEDELVRWVVDGGIRVGLQWDWGGNTAG